MCGLVHGDGPADSDVATKRHHRGTEAEGEWCLLVAANGVRVLGELEGRKVINKLLQHEQLVR